MATIKNIRILSALYVEPDHEYVDVFFFQEYVLVRRINNVEKIVKI